MSPVTSRHTGLLCFSVVSSGLTRHIMCVSSHFVQSVIDTDVGENDLNGPCVVH